jgi:predicted Fe-Mo cluster-binding NifX family protein
MKTAITSTGETLDSKIDPRFGRCSYFVIYDSELKSFEFIPNPNKNADEGAGPASVQLIAGKKVTKIVSGEFGIKIKPLLDSLHIQMIIVKDSNKTVKEIIELLNK